MWMYLMTMENQTAMQEFIEYLELTYGSLDPFIKEIYLKKEKEQDFNTIIGIIKDIKYFTSSEFKGRKIDETKDDSCLPRKKREEREVKSDSCLTVGALSEVLKSATRFADGFRLVDQKEKSM